MNDPYDSGTPKYSTARDIYDALCEMAQTEEMSILSEMFADVSYDNQSYTYTYTSRGCDLRDRFAELSGYEEKMWIMNLAVWQIDQSEIHGLIYEALNNPDMAKRLGIKKLFVEHMLNDDPKHYDEIAQEYSDELGELDRFDNWGMIRAYNKVASARGILFSATPYPKLCGAFYKKAYSLKLPEETRLIIECRALLTSYDDFIFGLRANQNLYQQLELQYKNKVFQLQADYERKVNQLMLAAEIHPKPPAISGTVIEAQIINLDD